MGLSKETKLPCVTWNVQLNIFINIYWTFMTLCPKLLGERPKINKLIMPENMFSYAPYLDVVVADDPGMEDNLHGSCKQLLDSRRLVRRLLGLNLTSRFFCWHRYYLYCNILSTKAVSGWQWLWKQNFHSKLVSSHYVHVGWNCSLMVDMILQISGI